MKIDTCLCDIVSVCAGRTCAAAERTGRAGGTHERAVAVRARVAGRTLTAARRLACGHTTRSAGSHTTRSAGK